MENLAKKKCVPCEGGTTPLSDEKTREFLAQVTDWELEEADGHKQIAKRFKFKDFKEAMAFINKVADIAQEQGHHPDIYIFYNKVRLVFYTHAMPGLHDNDFILAAKINEMTKQN